MRYKRVLSFAFALALVVVSIFEQDGSFESDANQVQQLNHIEYKAA